MKKLAVIFGVFVSSFGVGQDLKSLDSVCDSNYVFDYQMIYSDSTSSITQLVEVTLSNRFNMELSYFLGDFSVPNDLIIGISHPLYPEYTVYGKLCNLEKIFQNTNYIEIIDSFFKE